MTRKDYKRIASALRHVRNEIEIDPDMEPGEALDKAVGFLVHELRMDNPRFDPARFREAIYAA